MAALLTVVLLIAACGAAVARFTAMHPLVAAGIVAIVPALIATVLTAGFLADGAAVFGMALVGYLVAGAIAAAGAFPAWLRRAHIEGMD